MNDWKNAFAGLNCQLAKEGLWLDVICVGGFVLSQYGVRTTHDIDGFYKATDTITKLIRQVGDEYHINTEDELWLNNSVQNLNPPPPIKICTLLYDLSNLKVYMAPLDYIAGMKLQSAREQDIKDVAACITELGELEPKHFTKRISSYGFNDIDESLILESFGIAYGMDWLEKYYIEHEDELV